MVQVESIEHNDSSQKGYQTMTFTQKLKVVELKPFRDYLLAAQNSPDQLFNLFKELIIEVDLPEADDKEFSISFFDNTLKISRDTPVEDVPVRAVPGNIIAKNAKTKVALGLLGRMTKTDDPVMIFGENGTGKDLFARTIHQQSPRAMQPFVCFSCGTVGESEAKQQIIDALVEVGGGTLFLDDIQDLDVDTQRILQKLIYNPVEQNDFRVITATNVDLDAQVLNGEFSTELLTLLRGCYIELLPLDERKEDIEALVTFYMETICQNSGLEPKTFSSDLLRMLETYPWPGNVRELVNTVEQLLLTAQEKKTLFAKDLPAHIRIQSIESSAAQKKGL